MESFAIKFQLTNLGRKLLFATIFCASLTLSAHAQQTTSPPPIDRTNNDRIRQQEQKNREYQLRNLGTEAPKPLSDKEKKARMAQIEQDFNRILVLHNEIVRAIKSDAALDYVFVSEATGEIKKRSARLQSTLVLQQSDEEKAPPSDSPKVDDKNLKPALLSLCKHIRDFVTNPIIENPGTVSAEHLAKAKVDLANLINLSGRIHQRADQLK